MVVIDGMWMSYIYHASCECSSEIQAYHVYRATMKFHLSHCPKGCEQSWIFWRKMNTRELHGENVVHDILWTDGKNLMMPRAAVFSSGAVCWFPSLVGPDGTSLQPNWRSIKPWHCSHVMTKKIKWQKNSESATYYSSCFSACCNCYYFQQLRYALVFEWGLLKASFVQHPYLCCQRSRAK